MGPFRLYKLFSYCEIYDRKAYCYINVFSSFELQKRRRILFSCFKYRILIINKIVQIVLLFLTFTIASLLPLATLHRFALLKMTASANKNPAICGTKLRL